MTNNKKKKIKCLECLAREYEIKIRNTFKGNFSHQPEEVIRLLKEFYKLSPTSK